MKRLLLLFALISGACAGGNPTTPSTIDSGGSVPQGTSTTSDPSSPNAAAVDPTPGAATANATVPRFTISGPSNPENCLTPGADPMQWDLHVADAGPQVLRFVAMAHQEETPGCAATQKNPRERFQISGVTDYTPHSSGQTVFKFNPQLYNCGRVQLDVSIFDASGREILILGTVVNYGVQCAPSPLPPQTSTLTCTPPSQAVVVGQPAAFAATGGNGTYTWSTPSASPANGSGTAHGVTYSNAGTYLATVTSGAQTATCQVVVASLVIPGLVCALPSQTVAIDEVVTLTASGGTGVYAWVAPGGSTTSGSGPAFSTTYRSAGTNTVTVSSGGRSATCEVKVPPPPPSLVCGPALQTVAIGHIASVTATGGTGTYSWSAPMGTTTSGTGTAFSTVYPTSGVKTITVTSGAQTATCAIDVPAPPPTLVCGPDLQTVLVKQNVGVSATGGNGSYTWSAPNGSAVSGTGALFTTTYATGGTKAITVTSGSQTATCRVNVLTTMPCPAKAVFCFPS